MAKQGETEALSNGLKTLSLNSDFSSPWNRKIENTTCPPWLSPALSPSPSSTSSLRLWRPAAQRNLRNQWSKLASCRQQWQSASSTGKSHANSLVNAYLSQLYMPLMDLGALSDMPDIREKAAKKLLKQQSLHGDKLLLSYKEMLTVVTQMVSASRSMRCFTKSSNSSSPLVQFSGSSEDANDAGDGGGIAVYRFWSIPSFEELAEEIAQMFRREVVLKRLLVMELLSISCEDEPEYELDWAEELYTGERNDLRACNMYCTKTHQPEPPRLRDEDYDMPSLSHKCKPNRETLQVYLATWLAEVNINTHRVNEIFATIGEEMHVTL